MASEDHVWAELDFAVLGKPRGVELWVELADESEDPVMAYLTPEKARALGASLINLAERYASFHAPEVTEEMVLAAAKRMAFAGRHPNDVSRDAEHFWQCHAEEARARYLAMATAALQPGEESR